MKIFLLFLILVSSLQAARPKGGGLGITILSPTGFTLKHSLSSKEAFDVALAYKVDSEIYLHADYIHYLPIPKHKRYDFKNMSMYIPIGGVISKFTSNSRNSRKPEKSGDNVVLGVRMGGGLIYFFDNINTEIFAEIVPVMHFLPGTELFLDAAIGVRYYFF